MSEVKGLKAPLIQSVDAGRKTEIDSAVSADLLEIDSAFNYSARDGNSIAGDRQSFNNLGL